MDQIGVGQGGVQLLNARVQTRGGGALRGLKSVFSLSVEGMLLVLHLFYFNNTYL